MRTCWPGGAMATLYALQLIDRAIVLYSIDSEVMQQLTNTTHSWNEC